MIGKLCVVDIPNPEDVAIPLIESEFAETEFERLQMDVLIAAGEQVHYLVTTNEKVANKFFRFGGARLLTGRSCRGYWVFQIPVNYRPAAILLHVVEDGPAGAYLHKHAQHATAP